MKHDPLFSAYSCPPTQKPREGNDEGEALRSRFCGTLDDRLLNAMLAENGSNNVSWKRVIGIIQAANVVGGITGGGQPWSTLGGEANVNLRTGRVEFEVRGLVLAGGNSIGTPDAINQVKGTIVCGPGSATPFVADTPRAAQRAG